MGLSAAEKDLEVDEETEKAERADHYDVFGVVRELVTADLVPLAALLRGFRAVEVEVVLPVLVKAEVGALRQHLQEER